MIGHAPSTAEERAEALVVDVADSDRRDSDATDAAQLLTTTAPTRPPLALILIIGALPTPVVFGGMIGASSVFLALFGVEASWIFPPLAVLWAWPAARARVQRGWARACRKRGRQLALGLALWVTTVGGAVLLFYVFGRRTGEIEPAPERAAALGLDPAHPASVGFFIIWLSLVNPVLEEAFWRIFLYEMLSWGRCNAAGDDVDEPDGATRWWASRPTVALVATSALYATYHVSVLASVLSAPFACLGEALLFGYGVFLQLLTRRFGVVAAILAHAGGDAVVGFVLGDLVWDFLPLLRRL